MLLLVFNRLLEPMILTENHIAGYREGPVDDLDKGFPFPEELLPKHSQVKYKVPFMTLVSCLCELLRSGLDLTLVRRLWGHFCSSLAEREPEYTVNWSRSETVVS